MKKRHIQKASLLIDRLTTELLDFFLVHYILHAYEKHRIYAISLICLS